MHTGRTGYTGYEFFEWSFWSVVGMLVWSAIPTVAYHFGWSFIAIPWQPVAVFGTAVSFIIGLKNNSSYGRVWEARQIYGAIINDSRSFAYTLRDALSGGASSEVKVLFYRHFAWLTALRYQLREPRSWENMDTRRNRKYQDKRYKVAEWETPLEEVLKAYVGEEELTYILSKKNRATQLLAMQSKSLARLKKGGVINDFQWNNLQNSLIKLTEHQGKAERIKNFPYPRNFATITRLLLRIFIYMLPFALAPEFEKLGVGTQLEGHSVWFNILVSTLVMWAFYILDTTSEGSMNPFEGNANDVPITQISRTIEIDMRDMLNEENLPQPIVPENNIVL